VLLVPAINPDVTIIHVQMADRAGTVCIEGLPFSDVEQAKAARHVIVTCETLVDSSGAAAPARTQPVAFFLRGRRGTGALWSVPHGLLSHYDYDPVFLNDYRMGTRTNSVMPIICSVVFTMWPIMPLF
jgi:glutaconate CoA-transferase, subunit A